MSDFVITVLALENAGLILGLPSANERRRYFVTASLIAGRKSGISSEVVAETTSSATSDVKVVMITTLSFQWLYSH